jgi:predicted Zn-dependent protease
MAVDTLKQAIAVEPAFSEGSLKLAQWYLADGKREDTVAVLEAAHAMDRDDPIILNNLASLYMEDKATDTH